MTSELLQVFLITHIPTELILLFNPIKKSILYRNKTDLICSWNGK